MKYFVTGGSGFIGSNLIGALLKKDEKAEILSMDNYLAGSKENEAKDERVEYVKDNTWEINDKVKYYNFNPDYFFHLGEYARIEASIMEPYTVLKHNIVGTVEVLEFCRKKNCKLIYAGSSSIYTEEEEHKTPYTWSKKKNTELINNYKKWHGYDNWAIAYFSNAYGGNERGDGKYSTVVGIFKQNFIGKKPLEVTKPGTQTRAFTHIDDTISGLLTVAEEGKGDKYVIRADKQYSINEVAGWFEKRGAKITYKEGSEGRKESSGKPQKMKKLGWKAKIDLRDDIKEFLKKYYSPLF